MCAQPPRAIIALVGLIPLSFEGDLRLLEILGDIRL